MQWGQGSNPSAVRLREAHFRSSSLSRHVRPAGPRGEASSANRQLCEDAGALLRIDEPVLALIRPTLMDESIAEDEHPARLAAAQLFERLEEELRNGHERAPAIPAFFNLVVVAASPFAVPPYLPSGCSRAR